MPARREKKCCGYPARTTRAFPPRTWWNALWPRKASPATTWGREAFIGQVWKWKEEYGHRILNQIKGLGSSVDWTREAFTMDANLARAVRKVFVQLYNEGLIYKGKYIVNWCPRCHTALADDEVEHEGRKGKLWHVRYDLADGSAPLPSPPPARNHFGRLGRMRASRR